MLLVSGEFRIGGSSQNSSAARRRRLLPHASIMIITIMIIIYMFSIIISIYVCGVLLPCIIALCKMDLEAFDQPLHLHGGGFPSLSIYTYYVFFFLFYTYTYIYIYVYTWYIYIQMIYIYPTSLSLYIYIYIHLYDVYSIMLCYIIIPYECSIHICVASLPPTKTPHSAFDSRLSPVLIPGVWLRRRTICLPLVAFSFNSCTWQLF